MSFSFVILILQFTQFAIIRGNVRYFVYFFFIVFVGIIKLLIIKKEMNQKVNYSEMKISCITNQFDSFWLNVCCIDYIV